MNPATPDEVLDFAMDHLMADRLELVDALLHNPAICPEAPELTARDLTVGTDAEREARTSMTELAREGSLDTEDERQQTLLQRLSQMSAAQKIRLALLGSLEERMILVRDANKAVARAVLQSPKLSDLEIESYASMKTVTEEVLRTIAMNRAFMKHYPVARALINNPRAPIDVTLPLVARLNDRDLKMLSINKNVADVLRAMAAKLHRERTTPRRLTLPGKH